MDRPAGFAASVGRPPNRVDQTRLIRRLIAFAFAALFLAFVAIGVLWWIVTREGAALNAITNAYDGGDNRAVVEQVDRFFTRYEISNDNAWALLWKAEAQYQLGETDAALDTWANALAKIESLTNNVSLQDYAESYLRFAEVLRERGRLDRAVTSVETALRLEPQNIAGQIFLGQIFDDKSEKSRALAHYQKQLASSLPTAEERAVLAMKIARLTSNGPAHVTGPAWDTLPLYLGLSIGLAPLNQAPRGIVLEDVCSILEASWRVRCDVLPSVEVPTDGVWVSRRNQYDADALLDEVTRRLPWPARRHSHVVVVTDYDIFGPQTNFVYSWQRRNDEHAEAILSTSRLAGDVPAYYEPAIVPTRRVAIQALSTTGSMFRFERPTDAECPLAYPAELREFQMKRLRLCSSEEEQRDALLRRRGGETRPIGKARAQAIARVFQKYLVE